MSTGSSEYEMAVEGEVLEEELDLEHAPCDGEALFGGHWRTPPWRRVFPPQSTPRHSQSTSKGLQGDPKAPPRYPQGTSKGP